MFDALRYGDTVTFTTAIMNGAKSITSLKKDGTRNVVIPRPASIFEPINDRRRHRCATLKIFAIYVLDVRTCFYGTRTPSSVDMPQC